MHSIDCHCYLLLLTAVGKQFFFFVVILSSYNNYMRICPVDFVVETFSLYIYGCLKSSGKQEDLIKCSKDIFA